jgi:hypothetical protein
VWVAVTKEAFNEENAHQKNVLEFEVEENAIFLENCFCMLLKLGHSGN